jgi:hypothetical protein
VALHRGKIAEQKTGEGKTLSATTALYLNALTGKGVHLVTVNDYLARRDAGWMGQVFDFLGLKTAAIISDESFIFENDYQNKDVQDSRLIHLKHVHGEKHTKLILLMVLTASLVLTIFEIIWRRTQPTWYSADFIIPSSMKLIRFDR